MEIKNFIRQLLNHFFRGNNLFLTYLSALRNHNQIIISKKTDLKKCKFHISGSNNKIIIGDNCSLNSVVFYMNNNNSVIVGNDVIVNANEDCPTRLNACDGCSITIGDGCLFSNNIEIHTVDQIFYEIALEYNIYKDDNDFDLFNDIINKQIEKMKNVS